MPGTWARPITPVLANCIFASEVAIRLGSHGCTFTALCYMYAALLVLVFVVVLVRLAFAFALLVATYVC